MLEWIGPRTLSVGDTEFVTFALGTNEASTRQRFLLGKPDMVERFAAILEQYAGGNLIELGIYEGGSAAFAALVGKPGKLVALDIETDASAALDEFISDHQLHESIRPFWGVDQADRERLAQIVAEEFTGPLDLVIDDASHEYGATVASFEMLFPLLRPGGLYMIEDWRWGMIVRDESTPLAQIVVDLLALRAGTELIDEITIDEAWIRVSRGPGVAETPFRLERVTLP
jgi:predicted O-methyltransferase YrrM